MSTAILVGLAFLLGVRAGQTLERRRARPPHFRIPNGSEDLHVELEEESVPVRRIWAELTDGGTVTLWERRA